MGLEESYEDETFISQIYINNATAKVKKYWLIITTDQLYIDAQYKAESVKFAIFGKIHICSLYQCMY